MIQNNDLGKLVDLWMISIHQNGGFTKVWLSLKTIFFPAVLLELWWMSRRLRLLPRNPTLLEKMLITLGLALAFLDLPMEYLTLSFDMPWINLFNDIKQGLFYAALMAFWLVFAGEHLINDDDTHGQMHGLLGYWKNLSVVMFGCLCLFIFDLCERGVIWRFRFLMLITLVTACMTTTGFIIGQVSEGQYKWDEDISLDYTSAFMTFVLGLWNVYIMGLIFLYAPSHKQWNNSENSHENIATASTGEEIEFSLSNIGSGAGAEASEMSSLTDFIRHQATD